ncbi:MAG: hypothetical protein ACI94Y_001028, partial [Maribacter sp.]
MTKSLLYSTCAILLLIAPQLLLAQYDVASIPEELKKDAHIIIRNSTTDWVITSPKEAKEIKTEVVTFFDEKAENQTYIYLPYDEFHKITNISVKFYDKYGIPAGKAKSKAFLDISTSEGFQIDDSRAKVLDFSGLEYPFTYELKYETKFKGLLSVPSWVPVYGHHVSIEKASISIRSKKGYKFKYKEKNLKIDKQEQNDDEDILQWSIKDFPAIKREAYGSNFKERIPYLKLAPVDFELDGYAGSTKSWNDFGQWYKTILNDTESLPDAAKDEIRALVKGDMSDIEKIQTIYQYLQDNSRYVSIQLGIGGYKPFEPGFIHEKKYGDCKALSYYTHSMLDAIGIKSNLVLVNAGKNASEVDPDFPSNQFNHLFLCVPQEKDTIWLECTSQTNPFGFMGYFTSDRNVLIINEEGGELKRTPKYSKKENVVDTKVKISLESSGASKGKIVQYFDGLEYMRSNLSYQMNKSEKEQKNWMKDYYDISNFNIVEYHLSKDKDGHLGELESSIQMDKFASTVGKRMFFKPIVTNRVYSDIEKPEERKYKFNISNTYTHTGTYEFETPTGFEVEKNVKETKIDTKFGSYSLSSKATEGNKIVIERRFELNDGEF